ncbi:unnamed protein product [Ectocarpus sp. 12 AP-2014]
MKGYTLHYHWQPSPIRLVSTAQPPRKVYLAQPGHRRIARITQGGEVATRAKINLDSGWQKCPYNPVRWPPVLSLHDICIVSCSLLTEHDVHDYNRDGCW